MTHHLVGMAEIAEMLGVTRQRVAQLIESYEDFPAPEVELTAGRIWSRTAIETWIASHPDRGPGKQEKSPKVADDLLSVRFERFTDRARRSIVLGQEQARLLKHNYIGTEHLLLGLLALGEGVAFEALARLEASLEAVRDKVVEMIGEGPQAPQGHIPFTPRAKKVLHLSAREALALQHNYVGTEHVLLGLIREKSGVAWQALEALGLKSKATRDTVIESLRGLAPTPPTSGGEPARTLLRRLTELEERIDRLEGGD